MRWDSNIAETGRPRQCSGQQDASRVSFFGMSDLDRLPRSPEMMSVGDTALLVVDVQERLVPAIAEHVRVVWNVHVSSRKNWIVPLPSSINVVPVITSLTCTT